MNFTITNPDGTQDRASVDASEELWNDWLDDLGVDEEEDEEEVENAYRSYGACRVEGKDGWVTIEFHEPDWEA